MANVLAAEFALKKLLSKINSHSFTTKLVMVLFAFQATLLLGLILKKQFNNKVKAFKFYENDLVEVNVDLND